MTSSTIKFHSKQASKIDQDIELETSSCPLCHRDEKTTIYRFSPFAVARCSFCDFYYLSPRLKERSALKLYSSSTYFEGADRGYVSYSGQEKALRATFHRFLVQIRNLNLARGDLLEIGCGYGYLLQEAKMFFKSCVGTEMSPQAASIARIFADHIYEGDVGKIPSSDKFDCIIAVNVIEHLYEPDVFLATLCNHLRSEGKLILATPNISSLWRHILGRRWPSFKIPEHVLYFNSKSLSLVMNAAGLTNIISLPFLHAFPISLIANKLKIRVPKVLQSLGGNYVWIPGTMIAVCGGIPDA